MLLFGERHEWFGKKSTLDDNLFGLELVYISKPGDSEPLVQTNHGSLDNLVPQYMI